MTTHKEAVERALLEALDEETRPLFPAIYEEFMEADALAQGEDALGGVIKEIISRYWQDRNLQTLTGKAAGQFEEKLGLSHSGTIEERRAAIIQAINRRFVMNDAELLEIIQALPGGSTNDFEVDARALVLQLEKKTNTEGEHEAEELKEALETAQPLIPMNLETGIAVLAENRIEANVIYGWTGGTISGLGEVIYSSPPTLYNIIDTVTGEDKQCREPPKLALIDKGGAMFTSNKQLETIAPYNSNPTVDKGGAMFTSSKQLETIPVEGIEIIDLS